MAPAVVAAPAPAPAPSPSQALHDLILSQLDDAKAEDIVSLNLEGKSTLADTMIVASGRSNRHVAAIAEQVVEKLKGAGYRDLRVEGMDQADWVIVDTSDVIVHLFRPEVRSFYNLERLWSEHSPRETHAG
jgi:ribosome-associated protein